MIRDRYHKIPTSLFLLRFVLKVRFGFSTSRHTSAGGKNYVYMAKNNQKSYAMKNILIILALTSQVLTGCYSLKAVVKPQADLKAELPAKVTPGNVYKIIIRNGKIVIQTVAIPLRIEK